MYAYKRGKRERPGSVIFGALQKKVVCFNPFLVKISYVSEKKNKKAKNKNRKWRVSGRGQCNDTGSEQQIWRHPYVDHRQKPQPRIGIQ